MVISRLHVPMRRAEDVVPHLGKPYHWRDGRSAKCLAEQWFSANALPPSVAALLDQADDWQGAELIDAVLERCTALGDTRPSPSQTDLLAIIGIADRLGVVGVEAKVDEGFDKTVAAWLGDGSAGKTARLAGLCALFELDPATVGALRYQLFHRTAATLIEARRYRAAQAAMVVQSWCPNLSGLADYRAFFDRLGLPDLNPGRISAALMLDGISFRTGWLTEVG